MTNLIAGIRFLREAPETAIELDQRAGKRGVLVPTAPEGGILITGEAVHLLLESTGDGWKPLDLSTRRLRLKPGFELLEEARGTAD